MHWSLPPLLQLTGHVEHTRRAVLPHFDMLHMPTFRLDMLATCLAFTLCVVGAVDNGGEADFALGVRNEMTTVLMRVSNPNPAADPSHSRFQSA